VGIQVTADPWSGRTLLWETGDSDRPRVPRKGADCQVPKRTGHMAATSLDLEDSAKYL
jgi:hypothetical protein